MWDAEVPTWAPSFPGAFAKGWLSSVFRTASAGQGSSRYSFLSLTWNQAGALVLFAVAEMDRNTALSLRLILLVTQSPSFTNTVQHLPWCPWWPMACICYFFWHIWPVLRKGISAQGTKLCLLSPGPSTNGTAELGQLSLWCSDEQLGCQTWYALWRKVSNHNLKSEELLYFT